MKRGQHRIGLLLLLIVTAVGITGLVLTKKDAATGALLSYSPYKTNQADIPIPWEEVYGITYNIENAESWCSYKTIAEGGWIDPLKKLNKKQFTCYVVPFHVVPTEYIMEIGRRLDPALNWYPVLCALEGNYEKNPAYKYPIVCVPPGPTRF